MSQFTSNYRQFVSPSVTNISHHLLETDTTGLFQGHCPVTLNIKRHKTDSVNLIAQIDYANTLFLSQEKEISVWKTKGKLIPASKVFLEGK